MSQDQELQRWKKRWLSLLEVMRSLRTDIVDSNVPEKNTLLSLIDGLEVEGGTQANYFLKGFSDDSQHDQLLEDRPQDSRVRFSKEYALRKVLDRIAFDLDVIYLVFKQRSNNNHDGSLDKTLSLADKLALQALEPAAKRGLVSSDTKALTYLQKSYETRVIPYAEVSLIGAPFTSVGLTKDLLAIPHEIGHYVFWNKKGKALLAPIRKATFEWTEEIFADVYGCMVGGPVMAIDFQDLQLEFASYDPITKTNEFEEGVDKVHPSPILRPHIYSETLKKMEARGVPITDLGHLADIAGLLERRWQTKLDERGYLPQSAVPPPDLEEKISKVIDETLNIIEPENSITGFWTDQPVQNVEDLYDHFQQYVEQFPGPRPAMETTALPEKTEGQYEGREISVDEWLEELKAEGWTTEGPHGRS